MLTKDNSLFNVVMDRLSPVGRLKRPQTLANWAFLNESINTVHHRMDIEQALSLDESYVNMRRLLIVLRVCCEQETCAMATFSCAIVLEYRT